MSLHVTDNRITSDTVDAVAQRWENTREQVELGGPEFYWTVTTYPNRTFDKDRASTAMKLAEELARPEPRPSLIETFRRELA